MDLDADRVLVSRKARARPADAGGDPEPAPGAGQPGGYRRQLVSGRGEELTTPLLPGLAVEADDVPGWQRG